MRIKRLTIFESKQLSIQEKALRLEKEKLETEKKKLTSEYIKAAITFFSIVIPLLVVYFTVSSSMQQQQRQAELQTTLKIAELIINADGPHKARHQLMSLESLLNKRLTEGDFDPDDFVSTMEDQWDFLKLVTQHPEQEQRIIELWRTFWPEDYKAWLHKVERKANNEQTTPAAKAEN